ncbi:MAG: dephospho-CoA kinase [Chloroflexota bacterium]|nr:dephospho-CoA kinase [Chloroflexota bacterium]
MFIIGLTGGILSGKSTIASMLADKGATVIDADKLGHEAYKPNTRLNREMIEEFGGGIRKPSGEIDRKKLGDIVFENPEALARLNAIAHPIMKDMARDEIERLREEGASTVVLEATLLIEAEWTDLVDEVWVALAPSEVAVKRLADRGGITENEAWARVRSQLPAEERAGHADVVIDTDCDLSEVRTRVEELWERLRHH